MSQPLFRPFGFPVSPLVQFEQLFFKAAALTAFSTFGLIMMGLIYSDRASAMESTTSNGQPIIAHPSNTDPSSTSTSAADLVESPTIQQGEEITLPNRLAPVQVSERHADAEEDSKGLIPGSTLFIFDPGSNYIGSIDRPFQFDSEQSDRLTLFTIRF